MSSAPNADSEAPLTMSLGDHLEELRKRLAMALLAPLPLFIIIFIFFSDACIEIRSEPIIAALARNGFAAELLVLSPPEILVTKLKLSAIVAVVASAPWILFQIWTFVAPGLYEHERRFVYFLIPGSAILVVCGVALLYFVMLPLMMHVLVMFGSGIEVPTAEPDLPPAVVAAVEGAESIPMRTMPPEPLADGATWFQVPELALYVAVADEDGIVAPVLVPHSPPGSLKQSFRLSFAINFTLILLLGIVVAFQMPLVILLLGWMDLASVEFLSAHRRYAVVVCGVVAAMISGQWFIGA